jgi:hypothetical protein
MFSEHSACPLNSLKAWCSSSAQVLCIVGAHQVMKAERDRDIVNQLPLMSIRPRIKLLEPSICPLHQRRFKARESTIKMRDRYWKKETVHCFVWQTNGLPLMFVGRGYFFGMQCDWCPPFLCPGPMWLLLKLSCSKVFILAPPIPIPVQVQHCQNTEDMTIQTKLFYFSLFHALPFIHSFLCETIVHTLTIIEISALFLYVKKPEWILSNQQWYRLITSPLKNIPIISCTQVLGDANLEKMCGLYLCKYVTWMHLMTNHFVTPDLSLTH